MVMEEEVKNIMEDIRKLEEEKDEHIKNASRYTSDSIKGKYLDLAEAADKKILRRMEVLRIISRD